MFSLNFKLQKEGVYFEREHMHLHILLCSKKHWITPRSARSASNEFLLDTCIRRVSSRLYGIPLLDCGITFNLVILITAEYYLYSCVTHARAHTQTDFTTWLTINNMRDPKFKATTKVRPRWSGWLKTKLLLVLRT